MTTTSITAARLRRTLAGAPLDEHYQLEAALAWHQLRPTGRLTAARPAGPPLLSVTETDREEVAARLARLLHSLAWATVTRAPGHGRPVRIEVRRTAYDRVVRALSGTWRHVRHQFATATAGDPGAAAALWRMALLIGDVSPDHDTVRVRARTPDAAEVLANAAASLNAVVAVDRVRGGYAVMVYRSGDVRRLLVAAMSGA